MNILTNFSKVILTVFISVFIIYGVVQAGNLVPPSGSPDASFYTLGDIYNRLTTNEASTEGEHSFTFSNSLAGGGYTLKDIYEKIPTINPANIASGIRLLGVDGTAIISLGDAGASNVLNGKTFSNVSTANIAGTMVNNGAVTMTPGTGDQTILEGYHNGSGKVLGDANLVAGNILSGKSIFGVSGKTEVVDTTEVDAPLTAAGVLSGKKGFVNGSSITGAMPNIGEVTITPGIDDQTISEGYHNGSGKVLGDANFLASNIRDGISVFGITGSLSIGTNYGMPKTGQTTCYDTGASSGASIACAGTGQDGEYQKGFSGTRFTDNGNGTITDNATGLEWMKSPSTSPGGNSFSTAVTWGTALSTCNNSTYLSGGWRLPNIKELQSIADYGLDNPAINPIFLTVFSSGKGVLYWSSTTYHRTKTDAWSLSSDNGTLATNNKGGAASYVRCVR